VTVYVLEVCVRACDVGMLVPLKRSGWLLLRHSARNAVVELGMIAAQGVKSLRVSVLSQSVSVVWMDSVYSGMLCGCVV